MASSCFMNSTKITGLPWLSLYLCVAFLTLEMACSPWFSTPDSASSETAPVEGVNRDIPSTTEMISGTVRVPAQLTPADLPITKPAGCPKLDSQLNQVVQSPDPLSMAKKLNLNVKEDKVQVLLVLAGNDKVLLDKFAVEVGSQAGMQVQVFVAINQLCDLASTDEVLAIRLPAQVSLP